MRIGIVNDSVMACEVLRRVVLSRPGKKWRGLPAMVNKPWR